MSNNLSKQQRKELKRIEKFNKRQKSLASKSASSLELPVNVLCVRFGTKYGQEYVEKLRNMVQRHLTLDYDFVCLTDNPKPIDGVKILYQPNAGYSKGWWHKIHMFDPNLSLTGRILYFDLDVVIFKNIDKLVTYNTDCFLGIRDFNRKFHPGWKNLNSSVMSWQHKSESNIWNNFQKDINKAMRLHGDQDFIWREKNNKVKFFPDQWIQSYKWEIRNRQELHLKKGRRVFQTVKNNLEINDDCCVAVFHGDPNPSDVQDRFVLENWR